MGFEANAIDDAADSRGTGDRGELIREVAFLDIDRSATDFRCLCQTYVVGLSDDHVCAAVQVNARARAGEADRTGSEDQNVLTWLGSGGGGSVETGRTDVAEHGVVENLLFPEALFGGVQDERHVVNPRDDVELGLSAGMASHADVAVGALVGIGVDIEAGSPVLLVAALAGAAGDVEGNADDVADLDSSDSRADLDDLARLLVSEQQSGFGRGSRSRHVLV